MVTEDYCSYELSKLLLQKGLRYNDAEYESYYTLKGRIVYFKDKPKEINLSPRFTLQTACKWLREEHKIHIAIQVFNEKGYNAILCDVRDLHDVKYISETDFFFHAEKAVEAAIKYALENLL